LYFFILSFLQSDGKREGKLYESSISLSAKNSLVPVDYGSGILICEEEFRQKGVAPFPDLDRRARYRTRTTIRLVHPGRFRAQGASIPTSLRVRRVVTRGLILRETAEAGGSAGIMCDSNLGIIL